MVLLLLLLLLVDGGQLHWGVSFTLVILFIPTKLLAYDEDGATKGGVITGFDCVELISLLINGGIHQDEIKKNGSTYP